MANLLVNLLCRDHILQRHLKIIFGSLFQRHCQQINSCAGFIIDLSYYYYGLQFNSNQMKSTVGICCLLLIQLAWGYLDILLDVKREQNHISYTIPTKVNGLDYNLAIQLEDGSEFIQPLSAKQSSKKKKKHKSDDSKQLTAVIKGTSLEGYSFEGWKRFFMEALLYIESRYYHDINISLTDVQQKQAKQGEVLEDGAISFGPTLGDNKLFSLIKKGNQFIQKDVISIYRGVNDKNVRLQLGGFQQSFARGMKNGILFYELNVKVQDGKWKIPIQSVSCLKERNGKQDVFYIANSNVNLAVSLSSPFLKLPNKFASDFQRNFQSPQISCKINQNQRLTCDNMTSIDLALNFIQFKIDDGAFINISLYDLRDTYDEKTKQTVFFIQFISNSNDLQLGEALFKSYYVSIDMKEQKMLYSPLNRFPSQNYGVYVIRFLIGFGVFTIASAFGAMIWQTFNDPFKKNKLMYGQDGVRLVSYQRPNDQFNQIED